MNVTVTKIAMIRNIDWIPPFEPPNAGLQLRRAISFKLGGKRLLEKHAIAPSAARLCYAAAHAIVPMNISAF